MGRAQLSLEFVMILAISFLMLTIAVVVLLDFTKNLDDTESIDNIQEFGFQIVDEAKNVYVFGEDSFINIEGSLPESILAVYTVENSAIVFEMTTSRGNIQVPVFSEIPINGTRKDGLKTYVNDSGSVNSGRARFTVRSMGSWVEVSYS